MLDPLFTADLIAISVRPRLPTSIGTDERGTCSFESPRPRGLRTPRGRRAAAEAVDGAEELSGDMRLRTSGVPSTTHLRKIRRYPPAISADTSARIRGKRSPPGQAR
jgi:hypothetical protein